MEESLKQENGLPDTVKETDEKKGVEENPENFDHLKPQELENQVKDGGIPTSTKSDERVVDNKLFVKEELQDVSTKHLPEDTAGIATTSVEASDKQKTDLKLSVKGKAQNSVTKKTDRDLESARPRTVPVNWQDILVSSNQHQTETVNAMRLIADLENIPAPALTSNIDFRDVYHQIANAMEGKPIVASSPETAAVLMMVMTETSKRVQRQMTPELRQFVHELDTAADIVKARPGLIKDNASSGTSTDHAPSESSTDHELEIIRHLSAQESYNPLNIPEEYLKIPFRKEEKKE